VQQWSWNYPGYPGYWYYWAKSPSAHTGNKGTKGAIYKFRPAGIASLPANYTGLGYRT